MVTDGVLSDAGKKIMGYEAYISREAIQPLSDKLTELEMMDLYREIEIPTMFALHDMEVRGIPRRFESVGKDMEISWLEGLKNYRSLSTKKQGKSSISILKTVRCCFI